VWRERLINESSLIKNGPKGEEKRPVCLFRREKRGHAPFSVLNLKRNADPLFRPTSGLSGASLLKPWLHSCAPCLISCLGRRGSHSEIALPKATRPEQCGRQGLPRSGTPGLPRVKGQGVGPGGSRVLGKAGGPGHPCRGAPPPRPTLQGSQPRCSSAPRPLHRSP